MKSLKTLFLIVFALLFFFTKSFALGTTYYSKTSGAWTTASTWTTTSPTSNTSAASTPGVNDIVIIERGCTVTIAGTQLCASLQLGSPNNVGTAAGVGILTFGTGSSLTVSGTVTVGGYGVTTNTGTITFASGAILSAGNVVLGNSNATSPAAGTITMTAGGTLITRTLAVGTAAGTWTPGTGTVQLNATNTLPSTIFTTFNNLTINGGSGTTTTSSGTALTINGTLTVSTGTLVFSANNANYYLNGDFIVSTGATFTHSVLWNTAPFYLIEAAGNVSIDGVYNYTVRSHFQMTGTGKTVRTGTTAGSAFSIFTITGGATISASGTLNVNDNFWAPLESTGSFSTAGQTVNAKATLLVAGGTVNINGGALNVTGGLDIGYQTYTGTVNLTSGTLTTDNLYVGDTSSLGTFNDSTGTTATITNDLTIDTTGATSYICKGSPTINVGGDWTNDGVFTQATSAVTFNGTGGQNLGGSGTNTFYKLTINDGNDITLGTDINVSNTLTLTNGNIVTGTNNVIIPTTTTVSSASASSYINGNEEKYIASGTTLTYTFEIGDANYYAPVTLAFQKVSNSTGYILANTTGTDHPSISTSSINAAKDVNRYWTLANNGVTFSNGKTYNPTFTFNAADLDPGTSPTSFIVQEYAASAWTTPTIGTLTSTTSQVTGLSATQFGDFAIGNVKTTTSTVTSSSLSACPGASVTFTGTVTNIGAAVTTGTVTFYDGGTAISGNIALNGSGQATYTTTTLTGGSHTITVGYNGSTNYNTSTSAGITEAINTIAAVAGTISPICASSVGTALSITTGASTTNSTSVLWTSSSSPHLSSATSITNAKDTISAADVLVGSVTFTLTASNASCSVSTTKTLTINPAPVITISPNYCYGGGNVQLTATAGSKYTWTTGDTTQSILIDIAGNYTVTVKNSSGCSGSATYAVSTELVTNGNFSAGNTGFTTLYRDTTGAGSLEPEGYYAVGTNANNYHPDFFGTDHTTGTGNFMIVNGGASLQTIWTQTITIAPNTTYYFSAWAMSMNNVSPYAQLQFAINSIQVGSVADLTAGASSTSGANTWTRFYGTWTSGASTTALLSIVDNQTQANGNDFGLDDISFSTLSPASISAVPTGNAGAPVCTGSTLNLNSNVVGGNYPLTYAWTGPNSFSDTSTTPSISGATAVNAGSYSVTVTDAFGCSASGSTTVKVSALPVMKSTNSTSICTGGAVSIPFVSDSTSTYTWIATNNPNTTGESITLKLTSTLADTITNTSTSSQNVVYTVIPTSSISGCTGSAQIVTVTVNANATIGLKTGTKIQTVCINTAITTNTDSTTNATGATFSGLPTGVNGVYSSGTVTVSGIPSVAGTFKYYIIPTGCGTAKDSGTIIVTPAATVGFKSGSKTQTVCINTAITTNTDSTTNATGATFSGLPTGVNGLYNSGTVTISGTPTVAGTFKYYIIPTGCGTAKDSGTITVTPAATVGFKSGSQIQTVCISTNIITNTDSTTNATGATFSGLPIGVSGLYSSGTVTVSGTPTMSGTYKYYITTTGGCGTAKDSGTIIVTPAATVGFKSGSKTQTVCINTAITTNTDSTTNATGATFSGLPPSVNGLYSSGTVTISGTPSVAGTYKYYITTTGGCGTAKDSGTIIVTPAATVGFKSGLQTQTVCINTAITTNTDSTTNATGATFSGLPPSVNGLYSSGTVTISGTPSVAGTYKYYITTTGGCGTAKDSGTIIVTPAATVGFKSGSKTQTVCINTAITTNTDSTTNATGATFSGLPPSVNGLYSSGTVTISGTPSAAGTYKYYITTTGGCGTAKDSGTIIVTPAATVGFKSGSKTQTVCINTAITTNTDSTTNATGATFSGLPPSVNGLYSSGTVTISGTPSAAGTYKYYITTTGGCGTAKDSGTIIVTPAATVGFKSGLQTQTVCINTAITTNTDSTTNATGATFSGLPPSVNGLYSSGTVTISGTPSVAGTYKYYITTTGGCGTAKDSGTIIVTPAATVGFKSGSKTQTVCINTAITTNTDSTTNATGATFSGLPPSVNGLYSSGTVTISGTPSAAGTYKYYITTTGGCGTAKDSGTIIVTPAATVGFKSGLQTQTVCINTAITTNTDSTTNATGATFSGLPPSVNGLYSSGTVTISGTPSVAGTYKYYITTTGGCGTAKDSGTITVKPTSTLAGVTIPSTCSGNTATVNLTGLVPGSTNTVSYSIGVTVETPVSGVTADGSGNASFNSAVVTITNNGQLLSVTAINNGSCSQSVLKTATLAVTASGTWLGVNTNWNDASNWCGGVPTSTTDVLIPSSLTYYPDLTSSITGSAHNITIQSGASITVNNATIQVAGVISNSGTFDATLGSITLNGSSAQTIAGSTFKSKTITNLIISNTNGASLSSTANDTLNISGAVSFGNVNNANFNTNNNLTLLSNASSTASIADITNGSANFGNTITGKAVVQRFIPEHRAWRLLTAPVDSTNAPTISAAWQEGAVDVTIGERVNPYPGFGTHITGGPTRNASGIGNTGNNGFDAGPNQTSIYYFTGSAWLVPTNTSSTPITNNNGYMVFVRGDRSTNLSLGVYAPLSTTILRPRGLLNTGPQSFSLSGTGFHSMGNPFASTINYNSIIQHNAHASTYYYSMDPLMTGTFGVGSFVTYISSGSGTFIAIPDPSISSSSNVNTHPVDLNGDIESGSAFVVNCTTTPTNITINEQDKVAGSNTYLFRPSSNPTATLQMLRANIYAQDGSGNNNLLDGVLNMFGTNFSDSVDLLEDVRKMGNPGENLCLYRSGLNLTAEKRQPLIASDTIFYNLLTISHTNYSLEFISSNLYQSGLTGIVKDSYTGTSTPLNMNGTTVVNFSVDNTAASKAANRFMVVFAPLSVTPVTFTNVKASKQNNDIAVQWQVANEVNVKQYEVEKSADGTNFTTVATIAATGNNEPSASYNWLDTNPLNGENYYRIESIDDNGAVEYTQIVNVNTTSNNASITVFPNPVTNGAMHLQMHNMPGGVYNARLLNDIGQVIMEKEINHAAGSTAETISYDTNLPKGPYQLEIINPDNTKTTITIIL